MPHSNQKREVRGRLANDSHINNIALNNDYGIYRLQKEIKALFGLKKKSYQSIGSKVLSISWIN